MGWSREQNPTGVSNPAVRPIPDDPAAIGPAATAARAVQRSNANRRVPGSPTDLPIAANARKVDGFAPKATSAGQ